MNNLGSHILGSLDIKLSHHQSHDKESTDRPVITPKILKDGDNGINVSNAIRGLESDLMNDIDQQVLAELILTVNAKSDSDQIEKLQKALGMKDSEIDGKWSLKLEEYLSKY